jgi:uncharacterized protein (DUF2164 family)
MKKLISIIFLFTYGLCEIAVSQTFIPTRKVVIEDQTICATGWGIYSPRGIVFIDSFSRSSFLNMAEIISVHGNYNSPPDPMDSLYNQTYYEGCFNSPNPAWTHCNAWPQLMFDRKIISNPDSIFYFYNQHINDSGVADITVSHVYNSSTRSLDVTATTHFAVDVIPSIASYNLALVLTEDSVHGTSVNYAQRNAYSGGAFGPMATSMVDFVAQPDPVPASLMYYMNVARAILPSYKGDDASLPDTLHADSSYTYTFPSFTIPSNYNENNMRAIVLLIDTISGQINNANGVDLASSPVAVNEIENSGFSMSIIPNPFSTEANIRFSVAEKGRFILKIYDYLGRELKTIFNGNGTAETIYNVHLDAGVFPEGLYFCTLSGNGKSETKILQVIK